MTLTPKQFSQIATKNDVKDAVRDSEERLGEKIDKVLTTVDNITKKYQDHKTEHVANLGAHDRMQGEINETRGKVGLEIKSKVVSQEPI